LKLLFKGAPSKTWSWECVPVFDNHPIDRIAERIDRLADVLHIEISSIGKIRTGGASLGLRRELREIDRGRWPKEWSCHMGLRVDHGHATWLTLRMILMMSARAPGLGLHKSHFLGIGVRLMCGCKHQGP